MTRGVALITLLVVIGCGSSRPPATTLPADDTGRRAENRRTDADPVAAAMNVDATKIRAGETFAVTVVLNVAAAFEIQRLHAPPPAIATELELKLPAGFQAMGEWSTPQAVRSQTPDGHSVYMGEATFTRRIRVEKDVESGQYQLECAIRYQACSDRYCLRPVEHKLAVAATVVSPAESRR